MIFNEFNEEMEESVTMPLIGEDESAEDIKEYDDLWAQGLIMQVDGLKSRSLQDCINQFPDALNRSALNKDGTVTMRNPAQQKGFTFEVWERETAKIDALSKGVWNFQYGVSTSGPQPDGSFLSPTDPSVDLISWKRRWFGRQKPVVSQRAQLKMFNDEKKYDKAWSTPRYKDKQKVGAAGQGQHEMFEDDVNGIHIAAKPLTNEEATELSKKSIAQEAPSFDGAKESRATLHKNNQMMAIKYSTIINGISLTLHEIIGYISQKKMPSREEFKETLRTILCGSSESLVRTAIVDECVWQLGKATGKELFANSFAGGASATFVNTALDIGEDLFRCFYLKEIDRDDLLCRAVDNSYQTFAGFTGNWAFSSLGEIINLNIGAYFESSVSGAEITAKMLAETTASMGAAWGPIGAIVGAYVGSIVLSYAAKRVVEISGDDAVHIVNECIMEMNENLELYGFERYCFFADGLSELSEVKLSFKGMIPGYNFIRDLKELQLRSKIIKSLIPQFDQHHDTAVYKHEQQQLLYEWYHRQLTIIEEEFARRKELLNSEYREEIVEYVDVSYANYVKLRAAMSSPIDTLIMSLREEREYHLSAVGELKDRVIANREINAIIEELMTDPELEQYVSPFVARIRERETKDLVSEKQYLTVEEALLFVQGAYHNENDGFNIAS